MILANGTVDESEVFFLHGSGFEEFAQLASDLRILCEDSHATRFAIEAIYQMRRFVLGVIAEVKTHTTDKARVFVDLGGMTNQASGFVDHQ